MSENGPQHFTKAPVETTPLLEEGKSPHPHTFNFTKKTARFTKGRFRPYEGPPGRFTTRPLPV